jgi:hypothetical protein
MLINHKKVLRLMQEMNIQELFLKHKINRSKNTLNHNAYPHVLNHSNQVWATECTAFYGHNLIFTFDIPCQT